MDGTKEAITNFSHQKDPQPGAIFALDKLLQYAIFVNGVASTDRGFICQQHREMFDVAPPFVFVSGGGVRSDRG